MINHSVAKIGLSLSAIIFLVTAVLDPAFGGLCKQLDCANFIDGDVLVLLFSYSLVFLVLFLCMLFLSREIFNFWLKFAVVYIPLAAILFFIAPADNSDLYGLDSELIAWFTSGIFLIVSLLIILVKWLRTRKAPQ